MNPRTTEYSQLCSSDEQLALSLPRYDDAVLCDLYHDESQEQGYWHGMLLVPQETRAVLLDLLNEIRRNTGWKEPVCLKGLKDRGSKFRCIRGWLNVGVHSLLHTFKGKSCYVETGVKRRGVEYTKLEQPIRAKFILFRIREGHQQMTSFRDHAAKIETTFRMGLKGGLHLFAQQGQVLTLCGFRFDGYKHHGRGLDPNRMVRRLGALREGVKILDNFQFDDRSSDHRELDAQPYDDCQLLQLTDVLVSGFRTVLSNATNPVQAEVAGPLRELTSRWHGGPARMKNSRWFGGFCISECWLDQGEWQFGDLRSESRETQIRLSPEW